MRSLRAFREFEIKAVAGSSLAVVRSANDQRVYLLAEPIRAEAGVPKPLIVAAVNRAWPDSNVRSIDGPGLSDAYSQLREGALTASTVRVQLDDPERTWVHVDVASGEIVSVMDQGRRLYPLALQWIAQPRFPGSY